VRSSEKAVTKRQGIDVIRPLCLACVCFLAGMAFQQSRTIPLTVEAASDHLYELMIYHTLPGKAHALESVFRGVSRLQAKHGLHALGYWVPKADSTGSQDTFVYLLCHVDRQSADADWNALHADPAFQPFFKSAAPLIQKKNGNYLVDEIYISPTEYSDLK
jgi:hypothetical protein